MESIRTIKFPTMLDGKGKVKPLAIDFINDLIYMTFCSEASPFAIFSKYASSRNLPSGINSEDLLMVLSANSYKLLACTAYSSEFISVSIKKLLEEKKLSEINLTWRITLETHTSDLITETLEGTILK